MECSRPEYCSGYPFPSPGALPNPGTEPRFLPLQADSLPAEPPGKPSCVVKAGSNGYYVAWQRWAVSVSVPPLTKKEDPLKKVVATHSSTLLWEIPWTEEPGGLRGLRSQTQLSNLTSQPSQC